MRGFGAGYPGRPEINLQYVRQPGHDFFDEGAFVHAVAMWKEQMYSANKEGNRELTAVFRCIWLELQVIKLGIATRRGSRWCQRR